MDLGKRRMTGLAAFAAALMLVIGMMVGIGAGPASAKADVAHPVHIHKGTCAALGDVVFPLTNLEIPADGTPEAMMGTPMAATEASPAAAGEAPAQSVTTVKAKLADIISGGHAINAHESKHEIQKYIACGDITGTPKDGKLMVTLNELNNSGYTGEAELVDNGDGSTTVTLLLTEEYGATPAAASGSTGAAGATAIEIKNFSFGAPSMEIAVGTTVTWTNGDSAPHTVTQDGGGFQSGKIATGATFSFKFDKAGIYAYHCEYHANMKATIVVK